MQKAGSNNREEIVEKGISIQWITDLTKKISKNIKNATK